ncbi:hypothetical protein ACFLZR_01540, partial [Candidatus Neomarinimicrobiota bacterium]
DRRMMTKRLHTLFLMTIVMVVAIQTGCELNNNAPTIDIAVEDDTPLTLSQQNFTAIAEDLDEDPIVITWSVSDGTLNKDRGETVRWTAPATVGDVVVKVFASDRTVSGKDSASITLSVHNNSPQITSFASTSPYVLVGNEIQLAVTASDPDGEDITYRFFSQSGKGTITHTDPSSSTASWQAPSALEVPFSRNFNLIVQATDIQGFFTQDTIGILVYLENGTLWVVDRGRAEVSKYTNNGYFILTSSHNFNDPIAATGFIGEVFPAYVADHGNDEIVRLNYEGEDTDHYTGLPSVVDLAVHEATRQLFAISQGDNSLTVFDLNEASPQGRKIYGFDNPQAIVVNEFTKHIWVSDSELDGGGVIRLALKTNADDYPDTVSTATATYFTNNSLSGTPFNQSLNISIRSEPGATLFVVDENGASSTVERIGVVGTGPYTYLGSLGSVQFPALRNVQVTSEQLVWILQGPAGNGRVSYLTESGGSLTQMVSYPWSSPYAITAEMTGDVWIGDNGNAQVVKMFSTDSAAVVIDGFVFISDLLVNR